MLIGVVLWTMRAEGKDVRRGCRQFTWDASKDGAFVYSFSVTCTPAAA